MIQESFTEMAGLIMDYSGLCLCCHSNFEAMEEKNLSYEEDSDYLSFPRECKNLPTYLNTKEKWMETVLQSNCIHRWLYLMEGIFTSNIDACSERLIITNLTNDLIDIYPYDEFENDHEFEFWIILHEEEGGEYSKYNGEPYLFDPPMKDLFEDSGVPFFLSTSNRWTKMIMSVKHIDDYKKIMNYLFLKTHRYPGINITSPLQEDPEADTFIIQKLNRDLVYYNNMQKLIKI